MTEIKRSEELDHLAPNHQTLVLRAQRHSRAMRDVCVERLVPPLAEALEAKHIWLFGSVARNDAMEDSDADILVEVGDRVANHRFMDRMGLAYAARKEARLPFSCDIVTLSSEEIAEKLKTGNPFFCDLWKEKELIHESL
jgi:predicted nucleotidyltransferase